MISQFTCLHPWPRIWWLGILEHQHLRIHLQWHRSWQWWRHLGPWNVLQVFHKLVPRPCNVRTMEHRIQSKLKTVISISSATYIILKRTVFISLSNEIGEILSGDVVDWSRVIFWLFFGHQMFPNFATFDSLNSHLRSEVIRGQSRNSPWQKHWMKQ